MKKDGAHAAEVIEPLADDRNVHKTFNHKVAYTAQIRVPYVDLFSVRIVQRNPLEIAGAK